MHSGGAIVVVVEVCDQSVLTKEYHFCELTLVVVVVISDDCYRQQVSLHYMLLTVIEGAVVVVMSV